MEDRREGFQSDANQSLAMRGGDGAIMGKSSIWMVKL